MTASCPVSVLIPTLNEERNLPACLASVAWAGERIVFDSRSRDRTEEIALANGARFEQRSFDDFSTHKNWALDNLDFAHEWILILDADERVTPELAAEIQREISGGTTHQGYYLARKIIWRGRFLSHGGRYPDHQLRLLRRGKGRYERRLVHEHMLVDGTVGHLKNAIWHEDDKGMERYFDRHNHYSTLEAVEILRARASPGGATVLQAGPARRRALKTWAYRYLPARPLFVFLFMYFLKLGFLDGRGGFDSALLRAIYEYQIDVKLRELSEHDSPLARRWRAYIEGDEP
ncbi:MAG: glycosyltransferase family 2 protein [Gammaproteobacteria bacterium]